MSINPDKSEWIEIEAHRALFASVPEESKIALGFKMEEVNGIVCSICSSEPSILINRCFVTNLEALRENATIEKVKQLYKDAGIGEFFMHVAHNTPDIESKLQQSGMKKSRGWMKFKRGNQPAVARNAELSIREIGPEDAEAFAKIVVPCFDLTEASIPLIASVVNHPDYHIYMGFDGDAPAATGGVFYKDGIAHCDFGSTHRDFRGRGFQGALLARRINDAIQMGAKNLYTATGEAVPGDPQHSYKNIMRYGFEENYLRENWVPH